jgi:hypothetical protein
MTTEVGGIVPQDELRERLVEAGVKGEWASDWCDDSSVTMEWIADAIFAEIAAAGYELVPVDRLGRVGLALWSLMEEDGWTDELVGLEPGDRATIPGALTGDLDRREAGG